MSLLCNSLGYLLPNPTLNRTEKNNQPTNIDRVDGVWRTTYLSRFISKLNRLIQLTSDWSVGLAEISYPQSWYNVRESDDLRWGVYKEEGTDIVTESQNYFMSNGTGNPGR